MISCCFVTAASSRLLLHIARYKAPEGVVRLLLAAGASTTLEDHQGRSGATDPRHAALHQILQQHMDAGALCTQLIAVSDPSAWPRA